MQVLAYTTLYPSSINLRHGIFVETRPWHLLSDGEMHGRMIAPVPWYPFDHALFGRYTGHALWVGRHKPRYGIEIARPTYRLQSNVGMTVAPALLTATTLPAVAMASDPPVVASDVSRHRELIRDGETAVLFATGDQAARRFVDEERPWDRSVARCGPICGQRVK